MATPQDAQLILELYKLRTEATMRESRAMMGTVKFESYEEIQAIQRAMGTRENAAWRQVISYWEMAAALVLHDSLDADLFMDTNGENFYYYAKMTPFFEQVVKATGGPFMPKLTKLIEMYPAMQEKYAMTLARLTAAKKQAGG
jgi:hypothetical protein